MNPGDSRVFGDVGHYTDFGTGTEPSTTAQPEAVRLEGRSLRVQGKGAVGYKVYNAQGQLVMVANRHAFTIPTELDLSQITVSVAGGDGGEVEIFKNGKIVDAYNQPLKFDNPAGLTVSTGTDHPMGKYVIRNYRMFDGKYYYADAQTRPTEGRSGAGDTSLWAAKIAVITISIRLPRNDGPRIPTCATAATCSLGRMILRHLSLGTSSMSRTALPLTTISHPQERALTPGTGTVVWE